MALPWVKLHTSLIDNDVFRRLSRGGKLTFYTLLALAGKQDLHGVLSLRTGPMKDAEIAWYTGLGPKQQTAVMLELEASGFVGRALDGAYFVEKWSEKAGSTSDRESAKNRQKRLRERRRNGSVTGDVTDASRVTSQNTPRETVTDKDRDKELVSLRDTAKRNVTIPVEVADLRILAGLFVQAFGNCADPAKIKNMAPAYAAMLATMRSRGATVEQAWKACEDARAAQDDKPLFGSQIKTALSYLVLDRRAPRPASTDAKARAAQYALETKAS